MATPSEVKTALDDISRGIVMARSTAEEAKERFGNASAALNDIPTRYADEIATIQAYGTSDPFEAHAKAELDKLTTEFVALKTATDTGAAIALG